MNNILEFRAWNIPNKTMYQNIQNGVICENEKGQIVLGTSFGKICRDMGSIVMQFTYQKDEAGNKIFIGDILSKKWIAEVFQNDEGTFMVKFHCNPKLNKPMTLKKYLKSRIKAGTNNIDNIIIGNIYQNQELLSV